MRAKLKKLNALLREKRSFDIKISGRVIISMLCYGANWTWTGLCWGEKGLGTLARLVGEGRTQLRVDMTADIFFAFSHTILRIIILPDSISLYIMAK